MPPFYSSFQCRCLKSNALLFQEFAPGSNGKSTTMGVYVRDLLLGQVYLLKLFHNSSIQQNSILSYYHNVSLVTPLHPRAEIINHIIFWT